MENTFLDIFKNVCVWSSFCAWVVAQFTKMLCGYYRTRRFDFSYLVSTGGMPSAHSAMASGLFTAVGLVAGFKSPVFAVALAFGMVIMFDASTVRRAAGLQARVLNDMIDELFKEHRLSEHKLKELLGHTRLEVGMGMIVGILVAIIIVSLTTIIK